MGGTQNRPASLPGLQGGGALDARLVGEPPPSPSRRSSRRFISIVRARLPVAGRGAAHAGKSFPGPRAPAPPELRRPPALRSRGCSQRRWVLAVPRAPTGMDRSEFEARGRRANPLRGGGGCVSGDPRGGRPPARRAGWERTGPGLPQLVAMALTGAPRAGVALRPGVSAAPGPGVRSGPVRVSAEPRLQWVPPRGSSGLSMASGAGVLPSWLSLPRLGLLLPLGLRVSATQKLGPGSRWSQPGASQHGRDAGVQRHLPGGEGVHGEREEGLQREGGRGRGAGIEPLHR